MKIAWRIPGLILLVLAWSCSEVVNYDTDQKDTGPEQIDSLIIHGEHHYIHGYDPLIDSSWIRMVVEIPAGTVDKWEVDKVSGDLYWELSDGAPRKVKYLGYPGNYGMIPKTLLATEQGGDGDPLDILCLGPSAERGLVIPVRLVGVLKLLDHGEQDDKLIALPDLPEYASIHSLDDLNKIMPGSAEIVRIWFSSYKGSGVMESQGFGDHHEAWEILHQAMKSYQK